MAMMLIAYKGRLRRGKKMKNRWLYFSLVIVVGMFLFAGCGKGENKNEQIAETTEANHKAEKKEGLKVIATIFAPYDFARQIVGEYGTVSMLEPPASESHSFEPTPQDIINIQNCDVFIYIGGESESWVQDLLQDIDTSKVTVISCMDFVSLYEEELVEGMEEETETGNEWDTIKGEKEEETEEEQEYDEHIWTSPKNAIKIVEGLQKVFAQTDKKHAKEYEENGASYIEKLEKLDAEFRETVKNGKLDTIVFGDRFPLRYFVEEYGLKYYAAFPGCSEQTEPSASTTAFLIDTVREKKIPVVFYLELSNEKIADTICESTGAKKMLFHSCHNITKDDFQAGVTYLDLMQNNVEALKEALEVKQ